MYIIHAPPVPVQLPDFSAPHTDMRVQLPVSSPSSVLQKQVSGGGDEQGRERKTPSPDHRQRMRELEGSGPSRAQSRVSLFAARTLNATGQYRVTLSLRHMNLRAACGLRQEERGLRSA